jgi:arabinose-5-phosphate isomerase
MNKLVMNEALQLAQVAMRIDLDYSIGVIERCKGKVITVGMGKCGHVAKKVAATFASTGQYAQFIHPAEAMHGDLGHIAPEDVTIVFSNSGASPEIVSFLEHVKCDTIIGVSGTGEFNGVDELICIGETDEIDRFGIVPTTSTTAMIAIGDALAVSVMEKRDFEVQDFCDRHPYGRLGRD